MIVFAALIASSFPWPVEGIEVRVRNEATGEGMGFSAAPPGAGADGSARHSLAEIGLEVEERWTAACEAMAWRMRFEGNAERAGHEVSISLPIAASVDRIFTPTERGTISLARIPEFEATPYGANGWDSGRSYVLPLVSLLAPPGDAGLTIALPPDEPIPHLQVSWRAIDRDRRLLLRLAHRAMGGGRPATLRILFLSHPADPLAALGAYARAFPAYFKPGIARGPFEGAFWYHHIHDHPPFDEMERQGVRSIWASFWFPHLGEYLPDEREWKPYTYAKWWALGRTIGDEEIRAFARAMHGRGIGVFAYFNVTEYGGAGGPDGSTAQADRRIREAFSAALAKDAAGKRVLVNQFYRIEVLRDVDGYLHENDVIRGLGYLSPFRPVAAWHMRRPYAGDLLAFEAQLKLRILRAVFPQMIARTFPLSQQAPDPEAAFPPRTSSPPRRPARASSPPDPHPRDPRRGPISARSDPSSSSSPGRTWAPMGPPSWRRAAGRSPSRLRARRGSPSDRTRSLPTLPRSASSRRTRGRGSPSRGSVRSRPARTGAARSSRAGRPIAGAPPGARRMRPSPLRGASPRRSSLRRRPSSASTARRDGRGAGAMDRGPRGSRAPDPRMSSRDSPFGSIRDRPTAGRSGRGRRGRRAGTRSRRSSSPSSRPTARPIA